MKALFVLSIVVPVGLLTTFRLTGILKEPMTITQTITVDTVSWNMSRPAISPRQIITVGKVVTNFCSDETISINSRILIAGYFEDRLSWPSDGDDDVLEIVVNVDTNTSKGYIHSVAVRFSICDASSVLLIEHHPEATFSRNLKMHLVYDRATNEHQAYVNAVSANQPSAASVSVFTFLVFFDKNNLNHEMVATSEIIYFDGATIRKIIIPIQLGVLVL